MANAVTLKNDSSIRDVENFFKCLDGGKQVRAKDLGNGEITLYVRENSFKQFFMDKLRPDFLVKRDYQKARERILSMIERADPDGKESSVLSAIKQSLDKSGHKHDFYAGEFSDNLENALRQKKEISEHKNIIETSWQEENGLTSYAFLESHTTKAAIREIYDSIYDYNDKQKFKANYDALTAVTRQGGPADDNNPTIIDYKCAMDFCRTWLAQIDKASSATKNSSDESLPDKGKIQTRDKLTNFAQQVVSRGVPIQINLGGGKIANSDVDFLIFDFQGEGISSARLETKKSIATEQKTGDDEIRPYNLDLYSEMGIDAEKDTAGLGITYNQKFGAKPVDIDILYQQLEEMVDTRMTLKLAPSTLNSSSGSRSSNQIFTIHLPVLNPFGSDKLEEKQKALIVNAFAKSTQKWLEKYPNLRIKVQLPKNIEQNAIESAYRRAKSSTI